MEEKEDINTFDAKIRPLVVNQNYFANYRAFYIPCINNKKFLVFSTEQRKFQE